MPGTSRARGRHVICCVRVFLTFLQARGMVNINAPPEPSHLVREFRLDECAARRRRDNPHLYRCYVTALVDTLGNDPNTYTSQDLRDFVAKRYRHYGRHSIRMVLAAIRDVPALPGGGRPLPSGL